MNVVFQLFRFSCLEFRFLDLKEILQLKLIVYILKKFEARLLSRYYARWKYTHLRIFILSAVQLHEGGGVQSSSNSNHRHPNLFCGKRAPQLVISTTSNSNHPKKSIKLNRLFLRNKTILTSFSGPMVYNIVKAFFIAP